MKYSHEAEQLKTSVGGEDNIVSLTHCVTRLRFVLQDSSLCDSEQIQSIHGVKGVVLDGDRLQVVIGAEVQAFYEAMQKAEKQKWTVQSVLASLAEIIAPVLPFVIAAGILRGIMMYFPVPFIVECIHAVLSYVVPISLCCGVVKKAGGNEVLGLCMGIFILLPQSVEMLNGIYPGLSISLVKEPLPALMMGFLTVVLERFFTKHSPASFAFVLVPLCTITFALFLSVFVIPAACILSQSLYVILSWLDTGLSAILFGGVFAFFYPKLVTTGFQHIVTILDLVLMAESVQESTFIWPLIALANLAIGSAALAAAKLEKEDSSLAYSCFSVGVTEPALYGICRKYHYPLVSAMAGTGIAGAVSCGNGVQGGIGIGGIPAILSIFPGHMVSYMFSIGIALLLPACFVLIGKKFFWKEEVQNGFALPMSGVVKPLTMCEDAAFSSGMMGEGFVIEPKDGVLYAPSDGVMSVVFPTGHAYGLRCDAGYEILMHIGMDTVALNGKGFEPMVKQGERVKRGDMLCRVDLSYLKNMGKSCMTPVVFTDGTHVNLLKSGAGKAKENGFVELVKNEEQV